MLYVALQYAAAQAASSMWPLGLLSSSLVCITLRSLLCIPTFMHCAVPTQQAKTWLSPTRGSLRLSDIASIASCCLMYGALSA